MRLMMVSGRRAATFSTKSQGPASSRSSTIWVATRATSSSNFPIIRGVKARDTIRRSRACRGSSMLIIEPKYSLNSAGRSRMLVAPLLEQNTSGFLLASATSAWRTSAKYPGPRSAKGDSGSAKNDGCSRARSSAKAACRSAVGQPQKAVSERSMSPIVSGVPGGPGEAPGGTGEARGGTGEAPGGTGEAPGGTGEAPGGTGEAPGIRDEPAVPGGWCAVTAVPPSDLNGI